MRLAILLFALATAAALADTPPGPSAAADASKPAEAAVTTTAPEPGARQPLTPEALAAAKKKAAKLGMRIRVKNDEAFFCRSDQTIGTRFVTEKCLHESEVDASNYNTQQAQQSLNQHMCGSGACKSN